MNRKIPNLVMAAVAAVGLTAVGTGAVSAITSAGPSTQLAQTASQTTQDEQAVDEQEDESVNDNAQDGEVGQEGAQEAGDSVNNQDAGTTGK